MRRQQRQLLDRYDGKVKMKTAALCLGQITATSKSSLQNVLKKCAVSLQWIWLRISLGDGANETSSEKGSGSSSCSGLGDISGCSSAVIALAAEEELAVALTC